MVTNLRLTPLAGRLRAADRLEAGRLLAEAGRLAITEAGLEADPLEQKTTTITFN